MKKTTIASLLALALGFGGATSVAAQTCASPSPDSVTIMAGTAVSANTCDGSDDVAQYCAALDSSGGKKDIIYRVHLAPEGDAKRTATQIAISGGGPGFTPIAYLYTASCISGDGCAQTGEPSSPLPLDGLAAGDYWLAVSAADPEAASACGAFTLTPNGTLPVELKSFSVM